MIVFWSYVSFTQFLIIWSGNLKEEIEWYHVRSRGRLALGGRLLALCSLFGPFFVLLSRAVKDHPRRLRKVALLLLGSQVVYLYWLIAPSFHGRGHGRRPLAGPGRAARGRIVFPRPHHRHDAQTGNDPEVMKPQTTLNDSIPPPRIRPRGRERPASSRSGAASFSARSSMSLALLALVFHWKVGNGRQIALGSGQYVSAGDEADAGRTTIREAWRALDAENQKHLHGYRWIDREKGIVQIPIERAMELVAQPAETP